MKRTSVVLVVLVALCLTQAALAGPPRPSPNTSITQSVGLGEVTVTYCRPGVKGRTVFGDLEKWDSVWRTGANEATTITLSHDAKIAGKPLAAGTYALFTIPRESGAWTVVFNKEAEQWGAFSYKEDQDALRVDVKPAKAPHKEWFEISFDEMTTTSAQVVLHWQETRYGFKLEFDTQAIAPEMAKKEAGEDPRAAYQWAQFLYDEDAHLPLALELADNAAKAQERYWSLSLKARILHKVGQKAEATALAEKAIGLAPSDQFAEQAQQAAKELKEEMKGW